MMSDEKYVDRLVAEKTKGVVRRMVPEERVLQLEADLADIRLRLGGYHDSVLVGECGLAAATKRQSDMAETDPIPPPSACADSKRLARIRPEVLRVWLHSKGWRWFGSRAMAIPDGRRSTYEIALDLGVTLRVLTIAGDALDIYPGQVLAELEALEVAR